MNATAPRAHHLPLARRLLLLLTLCASAMGCSGDEKNKTILVGDARRSLVSGLQKLERAPGDRDIDDDLVPGGAKTIIIYRTVPLASDFPLTTAKNVLRKKRGPAHRCGKNGTLEPIILTTYTRLGDARTWELYPLAMDAWRCVEPGKAPIFQYPAMLAQADIDRIVSEATKAAKRGQIGRAEFFFRRLIHIYPNNWSIHFSLAQLYKAKVKREMSERRRRHVTLRYRKEQIKLLEGALSCDPKPPSYIQYDLGEANADAGRVPAALEHFQEYLGSEKTSPDKAARAQLYIKKHADKDEERRKQDAKDDGE